MSFYFQLLLLLGAATACGCVLLLEIDHSIRLSLELSFFVLVWAIVKIFEESSRGRVTNRIGAVATAFPKYVVTQEACKTFKGKAQVVEHTLDWNCTHLCPFQNKMNW